jgi:uncharacterized protein
MDIEALAVKVRRKLAETGATLSLNDNYPLDRLTLGLREFNLQQGIDYAVTLTNTGEAVLLTGSASATLQGSCERCLEDAALDIDGEVEGYYLFAPAPKEQLKDDYSQGHMDAEGCVDIAPEIVAAIVVEIPPVLLCSEDCGGIDLQESS